MLLWLGTAGAQSAAMTEGQRARYLEAHAHYTQGRYAEALSILDPLAREAPFSVFVLAVVRSHLRQQHCREAQAWLDAMPNAWPAPDVPAAQVADEIGRARLEVAGCYGALELVCSGAPILKPPGVLACGTNPTVDPGIHRWTATWPSGAVTTHQAEVLSGRSTRVDLVPPTPIERSRPPWLAAGLGAAGLGLVASAVIVDRAVVVRSHERFESARAQTGTDTDTFALRRQLRAQRGAVVGLGIGGGALLASAAVVFTL